MLVLTQKEGEILKVGEDVRIYIKRVKGRWVRLCIDAPIEIRLERVPVPKNPGEGTPAGKRKPLRVSVDTEDDSAEGGG